MTTISLSASIAIAEAELQVEVADTPAQIRAAHQLRYQVYCLERGFESGRDGLEIDAYDSHARHVLLRRRACGTVIGAARLVMPHSPVTGGMFPMQEVCGPSMFEHLPVTRTAEVSRFAISRERRGLSTEATSLSRLMLVRGLVALSRMQGITHWCAMMERTLLRLLRASAIHFTPIGPVMEYHGLREPGVCDVSAMLARMAVEQPVIYWLVSGELAVRVPRTSTLKAA